MIKKYLRNYSLPYRPNRIKRFRKKPRLNLITGKPRKISPKTVVITLAAAFLLYWLLSGNTGLIRWWQMFRLHSRLKQEIAALKEDNSRLQAANENLKNNPAAVEKPAREELGLCRKNETIYKIITPGRTAGQENRKL